MAEFYKGHTLANFRKPRKAWEEESAPEGETKKSFYPYFRKFAAFYRLLGCFPVSLSQSSLNLSYTWNSALTLCSVLVLPITHLIYLRLNPISDPVIKFFIYAVLFIPFTIRLIFIRKIPALIRLVQAMDSLDTDPCLVESDSKLTRKDCTFVVIFSSVTILLATFPHMILILGDSPEAVGFYWLQFQSIFTEVSQLSFFYVVCYQMNHFNDRFSASLAALSERPCEEVSEEQIESHRLTHARLVACVRLVDNAFGAWIGYVYVIISGWFVVECYLSVYGSFKMIHALTLLQVFLTLFYIYYPCVLSHRMLDKNKSIIHFILKMALEPFPDNELFQVMYFLRQMKLNVASVSAAGLAAVDKEIITKALALFTTCFVATIQLKPQVMAMLVALRRALEGEESAFNTTAGAAAVASGVTSIT